MTGLNDLPKKAQVVQLQYGNGDSVDVPQAATVLRRLRGLLFGGDQLLLRPCNSVHGFGMSKKIDVAYVNAEGVVLDVALLKPWRAHAPRRGAKAAWEAPEGTFERLGVSPGTQIRFLPA